jgi:protein-S-isoprenylcysteine O-methyltransferase Ste14
MLLQWCRPRMMVKGNERRTSGTAGSAPAAATLKRWPATLTSLAMGAAFFALWFWLLPRWLGFSVDTGGTAHWRWLAAIPSVFGFAVALRCVWDFARTGHGSPAPFAPPKHLVVVGFYRYVRNPIYVGAAAGWIGLWIVLGHASLVGVAIAVAIAIGVHLFVVFYEEPTLRKKFGAEYEEYCRNVRRWRPRVRGWDARRLS